MSIAINGALWYLFCTMLSYRHLTHIIALSRHGNFRKAATSLNMSHAAFSRSIARAEELLGVHLFDRQPSGVTPTHIGQVFLEKAPKLLAERADLLREINLLRGLESGDVSIAMGPYAADISGYAGAARLHAKHPNLKFNLYNRVWQEAIDLVLKREIDLAYAETSDASSEQLEVEIVGQPPFIFFCRTGHPLTRMDKINKEDFAPYPLVLSRLPKRLRDVFPFTMRKEEKSDFLVPPLSCDDAHLSRQFVRTGDAVSVASLDQIKEELRAGVFQAVPFWQDWMRMHYGFIYLKGRTPAPAVDAYMEEVRLIEQELSVERRMLWKEHMLKMPGLNKSPYD